MKRTSHVKKLCCILLAMLLTAAAAPVIAQASASANEKAIYSFLKNEMGLNTAAACGVLANIEMESNFNPRSKGDGGTSYGLCQWHASRFTRLKNYCSSHGLDYTTIDGQMRFLSYELEHDFPKVREVLYSVENTAEGAYRAAYKWCYSFEVPAGYNRGVSDKRGAHASNDYWPVYHEAEVAEAAAAAKEAIAASAGTEMSLAAGSAAQSGILAVFARLMNLIRLLFSILGPKAV